MHYNKLLALYFTLCAARKATTGVVIRNEELRRYFIRNPGERLSKKQLSEFAASFKPIFPYSQVVSDQYGPKLFLRLTDKLPKSHARVIFLASSAIRNELGISE